MLQITAHLRKLQLHHYFNREVSYWLQLSITGSKLCGFKAILKTWQLHVKRYEIDTSTEVCYWFTSYYGSGNMLDSSIDVGQTTSRIATNKTVLGPTFLGEHLVDFHPYFTSCQQHKSLRLG